MMISGSRYPLDLNLTLDEREPFTIALWVLPERSGIARMVSTSVAGALGGGGFDLHYNTDHTPPVHFRLYNSGLRILSADQPLEAGWQHITAVWDGHRADIYLNGQHVHSDTTTLTPTPSPATVKLGALGGLEARWEDFAGRIDDVILFDRALTSGEVARLAADTDADGQADFFAPTISATLPPSPVQVGETCQATVVLQATASDPDNDALSYEWSIGNLATLVGSNVTAHLPPGRHTFNVTVSDGKGGTATDSGEIEAVDTLFPVFTFFPPDQHALSIDPRGARVTIPAATATDNCGAATVTMETPPEYFPEGETTVRFFAQDAYGNVRIADRMVSVVVLDALFDDFRYECVTGTDCTDSLFGAQAKWIVGAEAGTFRKEVLPGWHGEDPGEKLVKIGGPGKIRLTIPPDQYWTGANQKNIPLVATRHRFGKGTYVARVKFSDQELRFQNTNQMNKGKLTPNSFDPVIQAFWLQTPYTKGADTYTEADFEYVSPDFWSHEKTDASLWNVTWDDAQNAQSRERIAHDIQRGGVWTILVIRVEPDQGVTYEVYDESGAPLIAPTRHSQLPPEPGSELQMAFTTWVDKYDPPETEKAKDKSDQPRPVRITGSHATDLDWVLHLPDSTELPLNTLLELIGTVRKLRIDTTGQQ